MNLIPVVIVPSYVHHLENAIHFTKEIKVTIEIGHGNHLGNEYQ